MSTTLAVLVVLGLILLGGGYLLYLYMQIVDELFNRAEDEYLYYDARNI